MVGPPSSGREDREDGHVRPDQKTRLPSAASPAAISRAHTRSFGCHGDHMFLMAGLVLLVVWFLGVLGLYELGAAIHLVLLVGLMTLLLAVLRQRDEVDRTHIQ